MEQELGSSYRFLLGPAGAEQTYDWVFQCLQGVEHVHCRALDCSELDWATQKDLRQI